MELKELLCSLEERLVQHDNNRKEVQYKLQETCSIITEEANLLEEKINEELQSSFNSTEERILNLIEKLNNTEEDEKHLIKQAQEEHSIIVKYDIQQKENANSFVDSYKLEISKQRRGFISVNENNVEKIVNKLKDHLNKLHESMDDIQDKLTEICTKRRNEAEELKKKINDELETSFAEEDSRIQKIVNSLKEKSNDNNDDGIEEELKTKAKLTLLINQKYSLDNDRLIVIKEASLKWIDFKERKPSNITPSITNRGEFSLPFTFFSANEISVLKTVKTSFNIKMKVWNKNENEIIGSKIITKKYVISENQPFCFTEPFNPSTTYCLKMRIEHENLSSQWSDIVEFITPEFKTCIWKKCPDYVSKERKYSIDIEVNPRVATKVNNYYYCIIIGNIPLPLNKVTSWDIKILKSNYNNGYNIYVGVAPFDIDQNENNFNTCGWYFNCYDSTLSSGPPHNYIDKKYGPRRDGEYVREGDSVGVIMDTTKGELSFALNGVNYGGAYEGVPLYKPLVPCVSLGEKGDSVELDTSDVKENVGSSVFDPSNITAKSGLTWDSITLSWDAVEGASFYQIEVDGLFYGDIITLNSFTKINLLEETEHRFRVRTVRDNAVSGWSDVVKVKTTKESFENSGWKECSDYVDEKKKYFVDKVNPRIASSTSYWDYDNYCTIIGNTFIPLNKVTSWSIKILKSRDNDGNGIFVGVAPSDIDQNENYNFFKRGWYFYCFDSALYSGPPHNYKKYGLRKRDVNYIHTGDSVCIVMDTTKGELSFLLNGVSLGIAYEGIPLDKPLVPCVILSDKGDSVELDTSELKRTEVDNSIPIPSNITTKSSTWDSITLIWDHIKGASFYQIETDGSRSWDASTTNSFTRNEILEESEHSFRIRTIKGTSVSEWSDVVKGRTQKAQDFSECVWKECPGYVEEIKKYFVDKNNHRIATKDNCVQNDYCCTIIGNVFLPLNKVSSWDIEILKSRDNNDYYEYDSFIGVAPFDIDQNEEYNCVTCGWYFDCYKSTLWSGPPHNYRGKDYGPRKKEGNYVHTGDIIGVVMDTTKGELSFLLNGVSLGVAYEGILLDKPLVPCVVLYNGGDSVELDPSEVKENEMDISIPVPYNITTKSTTWDSITLTWDAVGGASFYQIEVDGSKFWDVTTTNSFTKRVFLPETEHSFRMRTVRGSSVSEWSGAVKGRTAKESFENSGWKECSDDVNEYHKYFVDKVNLRIATKVNDYDFCTIIGNTPLPLNKVILWNIKILKSRDKNGLGIFIGVAPFDINQNEESNYNKCGWYFDCYFSVLVSGPPHNYKYKEYGPRKERGEYVHTGDIVGVVMDTTKGELSFVLDEINLGVAYERIQFDIPLVPCIFLYHKGDSVELII